MKKTILIGHGSGGLMTGDLIRDMFIGHFNSGASGILTDSAILNVNDSILAFTTDSFVIDPVFFPGGNIGKLAVCGTVNDLAVSGAIPLYLSAGFIIEEGFPMEDLEHITAAMAEEARNSNVRIVTGDTKVVKRGQCDKIFINTAGIGLVKKEYESISKGTEIKPGDRILVNGFLGDHEMAILAARENLRFEQPVTSDVACLNSMIQMLLEKGIRIHFMRDITRGGLATILAEITESTGKGILIDEQNIPIREEVNGLCEVYGFNPLYLANEGKVLMIVSGDSSDSALELMHNHPLGIHASAIGTLNEINPGKVLMKSIVGGTRIIDKLAGEQLPRIC